MHRMHSDVPAVAAHAHYAIPLWLRLPNPSGPLGVPDLRDLLTLHAVAAGIVPGRLERTLRSERRIR